MFSTVTAVILVVVFLMPGFVLVQTLRRVREYPESESDLALSLRALGWSLLIHLAFIWWTADLFNSIKSLSEWPDHRGALAAYVFVVVLVVPVIVGIGLGSLVKWLERVNRSLKPWQAAVASLLGANPDPPTAWERLQPFLAYGAIVVVQTKAGHTVAGKFGAHSFLNVGDKPELLLEEVWSVEAAGQPGESLEPSRAVWIAQAEVDSMQVISIPPPADMR